MLWTTDQGENNCADTPGNSATKSGYGCEMAALVASWREIWSAESGTTDPEAPFGIVSLASGGSEGHDEAIGGLRWSQSGNYGTLPNELMKKTFLAHAYDLGDPMDGLKGPCVNDSAHSLRHTNQSAFSGPDAPCTWPDRPRRIGTKRCGHFATLSSQTWRQALWAASTRGSSVRSADV